MALVERCQARVQRTFEDAAAAARAAGEPVMPAMGRAYVGLLGDRNLLLSQLNAHAACDDPAIRRGAHSRRAPQRARRRIVFDVPSGARRMRLT